MDFNMIVQADRQINPSSYRYRCEKCRVVIGYKGVCHTCKERMEGTAKGIFKESGWVAEVSVLKDNSNDEWEKYNLEVIKTIHESPIFKTPADGHQFEVSAKRKYRAYVDWELQIN